MGIQNDVPSHQMYNYFTTFDRQPHNGAVRLILTLFQQHNQAFLIICNLQLY